MAGYYIGNKFKIVCGNNKIKKGICGGNIIYSGANPVTYYVDTDIVYVEEADEGDSVLSPSTFTPSKSGWTFVGWREDNAASSSVYSNLVMEDTSITLYAVFEQTITLSYNGNGSTSGYTESQTKAQYYNNGNVVNPSFTLMNNGFTKTNHSFINWAIGSANGMQYAVGDSVTLSASTVFYAVWEINDKVLVSNYIPASGYSFVGSGNYEDNGYNSTWRYGFSNLIASGGGEDDDGDDEDVGIVRGCLSPKVDVTNYKKLIFTVYHYNGYGIGKGTASQSTFSVGLLNSTSGGEVKMVSRTYTVAGQEGTETITVDVSNISGSYHVGVVIESGITGTSTGCLQIKASSIKLTG